jgi:hypothetical protein
MLIFEKVFGKPGLSPTVITRRTDKTSKLGEKGAWVVFVEL